MILALYFWGVSGLHLLLGDLIQLDLVQETGLYRLCPSQHKLGLWLNVVPATGWDRFGHLKRLGRMVEPES